MITLVILAIPSMALHIWAEQQCTRMDVETGRRDAGALVDDYGSNRGWYWKYKPLSILGALLAAPGLVIGSMGALALIASN